MSNKVNRKQPELAVESSHHIEECNGEEYLKLCERHKRGEIYIYAVAAGIHFGARHHWTWRATYEIITTLATETAQPTLPRETKATQIDLLAVDPNYRRPFNH